MAPGPAGTLLPALVRRLARGKLVNADLTEADFTGADFTGADLSHATLTGANLSYATLTGATVNNFLNSNTLIQVATDASFFAIMAIGATIVIISGGIDLSVGSTYALAGVSMALALRALGPTGPVTTVVVGVAASIGVGLLCGIVNGLLVGPGDTAALGDAVRRYFADEPLRNRLRSAAASSVAEYAPERVFGELEQTLRRIAGT